MTTLLNQVICKDPYKNHSTQPIVMQKSFKAVCWLAIPD
jgi:hypothetical protein